jgi:hypothetical protein
MAPQPRSEHQPARSNSATGGWAPCCDFPLALGGPGDRGIVTLDVEVHPVRTSHVPRSICVRRFKRGSWAKSPQQSLNQ